MSKGKSNRALKLILLGLVLLSFFVFLTMKAFAETDTDQPNNTVKIGDTVYDITSQNGLVDADLALLQWEAKGSSDNSTISGVFSNVLYTGFDDVYAQVYGKLLEEATDVYNDGDALLYKSNFTSKENPQKYVRGTHILKIKENSTVYLNTYIEVQYTARVVIVAEGSATILVNAENNGKFTLGWETDESDSCCFAIQGSSGTSKINITGNEDLRNGGASLFRLRGGSVYLNNVRLGDFNFNDSLEGDSVIFFEAGFDKKRNLYFSNSSIENISGKSPGILMRAYSAESNVRNALSKAYIYNSLFDRCRANVSSNYAGGPAIRSYAADNSSLRIESCRFLNNVSESGGMATGGGAVYWKSVQGEAELIDCEFSNNSSATVGGAIYNTGIMTLVNCRFYNNSAANGGAIAATPPDGAEALIPADNLSGSLVLDSNTEISGNVASNNGGAIYFNIVPAKDNYGEKTDCDMQIEINGARIHSNTANNNGGAIAMLLDYGDHDYETGITINSGTLTDNNALNGNGGAIWMSSTESCACVGNSGVTMSGGELNGNSAVNGGAIYIETGKSSATMNFTMNAGTVVNNAATENGGAVYVAGGDFIMSNGNLGADGEENTAKNGGAVYVDGGDAEIKGGAVSYNCAEINGGGIAVNNGEIIMSGGTVGNNTAKTGSGGGLYASSTGENAVAVTVYSGRLSGNKSAVSGGAVGIAGDENSTITVQIGLNKQHRFISDNVFEEIEHSPYIHTSCPVIENNSTDKSGGAFFISGGSTTNLNIYCLKESNNTASGDKDIHNTPLSNFLMVEGGMVVVSTAEDPNIYIGNDNMYEGDASFGNTTVTGSIHVVAGVLELIGSMDNPKLNGYRTIDLRSHSDRYYDHRTSDAQVKVSYHENFYGPDGEPFSTQTAFDIKSGSQLLIESGLYVHNGYELVGWNIDPNAKLGITESGWYWPGTDITLYNPNDPTSDGVNEGNLVLYAIWKVNGYFIAFNPGVATGENWSGIVSTITATYDTYHDLPENSYIYVGYIFVGWKYGDKIYQPGDKVINLTSKNAETVTFVAQWIKCGHTDECTYSVNDTKDVLIQMCPACHLSATARLTAQDSVYDGGSHLALTEYSLPEFFAPEITYTGKKIESSEDVSDPHTCVNAGNYTATITGGGVTASVSFTIHKAQQTQPTEIPVYSYNKSGPNLEISQIVSRISSVTGAAAEYVVRYYEAGELNETVIPGDSTDNKLIFHLEVAMTTYSVHVRYSETDNYLASDTVKATMTFYFDGNVSLNIVADKGIDYGAFIDAHGQMTLTVVLEDGYYLIGEEFVLNYSGYEEYITVTKNGSQTHDPESASYFIVAKSQTENVEVFLYIGATKKVASITSSVKEKEYFNNFTADTDPVITRDSAFTVLFGVSGFVLSDYEIPILRFNQALPKNTTVILRDRTDESYWYYKVLTDTQQDILLSQFKKMDSEQTEYVPTDGDMNLQFVVDFSKATSSPQGELLIIRLFIAKKPAADEKAADISDAPGAKATVGLANVSYDMTETNGDHLNVIVEMGGAGSKYDARDLAIVLTNTGNIMIPIDAGVIVRIGDTKVTYRPDGAGRIIIPLGEFREINDTIQLQLTSDMFPMRETTYRMTAELYLSESKADASPLNGLRLVGDVELTFTSFREETSVRIVEISGNNSRIYTVGDRIAVKINTQPAALEDRYTVSVQLHQELNGAYGNTLIQYQSNGDEYIFSLVSPLTEGNYCIVATLTDTGGYVVTETRYYFILTPAE